MKESKNYMDFCRQLNDDLELVILALVTSDA
jgi:hypothetical protein